MSLDELRTDLGVTRKVYGDNHPQVAYVHSNIAHEHLRRSEFQCALDSFSAAATIYRSDSDTELPLHRRRTGHENDMNKENCHIFNPKNFLDKVNAAAVLNNLGLIHQRMGNNTEAIDSYTEALSLYILCHNSFQASKENTDLNTKMMAFRAKMSQKGISAPPLNLDLKIAQTLQSIARLHTKFMDNIPLALRAHEDTVTFLMEGYADDNTSTHPHYESLEKKVISKEESTRQRSPTSVSLFPSLQAGNRRENAFNVVPVTEHERVKLIASSLNSLAKLYSEQEIRHDALDDDDAEDALNYYMEALNFLQSVSNPVSKTSIPALAEDNRNISRVSDAALSLSTFCPSLTLDLRIDIGYTLFEMGKLLQRRCCYEEAIEKFEQARFIRGEVHSRNDDHEEIVECWYALGLTYESYGNFNKALSCYQHVLKVHKAKFGLDSIEVANMFCHIGNALWQSDDLAGSLSVNKQALTIYKRILKGTTHSNDQELKLVSNIIGVLNNQGGLCIEMEEVQMSIECYEEALSMQTSYLGADHPDITKSMNILGDLYTSDGSFEKAVEKLETALTLYRKYGIGEKDPDLISTKERLIDVRKLEKKSLRKRLGKEKCKVGLPPRQFKRTPCEIKVIDKILDSNGQHKVDDDCVSQITTDVAIMNLDCEQPIPSEHNNESAVWHSAEFVVDKMTNAVGTLAQVTNDMFNGTSTTHEVTYNFEKDRRGNPSSQGFELKHETEVMVCASCVGEEIVADEGGKTNSDDLLAQMNVITCEDDNNAKPFKDIVRIETFESESRSNDLSPNSSPDSLSSKRKKFEKVNSLLDKLIEQKDSLGPKHPQVLYSMNALGDLYVRTDEHMKGLKLYKEILNIQKVTFGTDHKSVADILVKIGDTYSHQHDFDEASMYYDQSKDIFIYLFGKNNLRVAHILNKMGLSDLHKCEFDSAMDHFQEALRIQRSHLAPNEHNPDVSQTLVNIGSVYYKERNSFQKIRSKDTYTSFIESGMLSKIAFAHAERGEYIMAMQFYEEVLQLLKNKGERCYSYGIAKTLNCLGSLSLKCGRYAVAIEYHQQGQKILKKMQHHNSIDLCDTRIQIANVEYQAGNFKVAKDLLEEALKILRDTLGGDDTRVAKAIYHIGMIQFHFCEYDSSMQNFDYALRIQQCRLQKDHPDIIRTLMGIGRVHLNLNKVAMALNQFNEVLIFQRQIFGREHPEIAETMLHLGMTHQEKGDNSKAMSYYEKSFETSKKLLGVDCPMVASSMTRMALLHQEAGRHGRALTMFQDVLRLYREYLGDEHFEVSKVLVLLGSLYNLIRNFADASKSFQEAMQISVNMFGPKHQLIGDIHVGMGNTYLGKCQYDEANSSFAMALAIYNKTKLSDDHPKMKLVSENIARARREEDLCV